MSTDSLQDWIDTYVEDVPNVTDSSGPAKNARWTDARVTGKLDTPGLVGLVSGTGFTFTFNKAVYQSQLSLITGIGTTLDIQKLATAWETAVLASAAAVLSGTSIGSPPTNVNTWSAAPGTVIDIPSIALGKAKILELVDSPDDVEAEDSEYPVKMREAFLLLTMTTTGPDSTPPGSGGPLTLIDLARSVV